MFTCLWVRSPLLVKSAEQVERFLLESDMMDMDMMDTMTFLVQLG